MARVTLLGLPRDLGNELASVLAAESHSVSHRRLLRDLRRGPVPRVVFISGEDVDFRATIGSLRSEQPQLPVVVVTRLAETAQWLDALDAGAMDYCGAPFERIQMRWIMSSVMQRSSVIPL